MFVLLTIKHFLTSGHDSNALSVVNFKGIVLPPLTPSSAVITYSDWQSLILPAIDSAENPPNIIECTAPILAQANIIYANSGIIVKYMVTLSPFFTPIFLSTFAALDTFNNSSL